MESFQLIIALVSIILFLRVYWIQASSNSLISMMNMQNKKILNEIEFGETGKEIDRKTIIEALSYLNLVSKLYLNHSINVSMLRTFEGVMIKLLDHPQAKSVYHEIFTDFQQNVKTAEPPYINLIYATNMLVNLNTILNKRSWFSSLYAWFYIFYKKHYFTQIPHSKTNWELAANVFST